MKLVGEDAELLCKFSSNEKIYSIKWWKNNEQFYQYVPRNSPAQMVFDVSGLTVDVSQFKLEDW